MYKIVNGTSPEIMNVFQIINNTHYNLRYARTFLGEPIHSVFNGSESRSYKRDNDTGEEMGGGGSGYVHFLKTNFFSCSITEIHELKLACLNYN